MEHLKTAIGLFTDDMFISHRITPQKKLSMPISMTPMGLMIPDVVEKEHDVLLDIAPDSDRDEKEKTLTFAAATTQACHLLNALESLSDAYAALRDWEKAMYTANSTIEVCQALLVPLNITGMSGIMNLSPDGVPSCSPLDIVSAVVSKIKIRDHVALALRGQIDENHDDDGNGGGGGGGGDGLRRRELETAKQGCIANIRLKYASALFAKGHMMMKILHHDVDRDNGESDTVTGGKGLDQGYTFAAMDSSLSTTTLHDLMGSKAPIGLANTSAVDVISSLWMKSAKELEEMGNPRRAFSVYKDLATMWSNLADVKPYSDSLFRVVVQVVEIRGGNDASPPSTGDSAIDNESASDAQTSRTLEYAMPLQHSSLHGACVPQAAVKAKDSWIAASDAATALCQRMLPSDEPSDPMDQSNANCSASNARDVSQEILILELRMSAWQEVIQCQYNAGLCALLFSIAEAGTHFERAQDTKCTYLDIAGALNEAEKRQLAAQIDIDGSALNGKSVIMHDNMKGNNELNLSNVTEMKKKKKRESKSQCWLSYNTLCCDISFHLAYTYIRSNRIADAIAEAEMAIGLAMSSSESRMRRRKCWGVLALCFNASGQPLEVERALRECGHLRPTSTGIPDDGNDEYIKELQIFMDRHAPKRRKEVLASLRVASMYSSAEVQTLEPVLESTSRTSINSSAESEQLNVTATPPLNLSENKVSIDSKMAILFFIGTTTVFFMILSICVAFLL